jgi:two-component system NtrC family sensor kinase
VLLDKTGRVTMRSSSAVELLRRIGLESETSCLMESGVVALRDLLQRALASRDTQVAEVVGSDGHVYGLRVEWLEPARSRSRLGLQIRDLRLERHLEQRCLELEKCEGLDRLIPRVVHDVRNPLTAASVLIESVCLAAALGDQLRTKLETAVQQLGEACGVLESLSKYSREGPPTYQPHGLNDSVLEVVELHRVIIERRGIQLRLELDQDLPPIYGDPSQLKQLITNLLMNAADAIEGEARPGNIWIRTSSCRGIPRLTVEDDGPGIPADISRLVFTPFFTTKPPGMGTGLGLAICRGIARAHGGHLSLRPREPHGSVFLLDLPDPRSMRPAKDRALLGVVQSDQPVRHALLVEADQQLVELASQALRRRRYTVHVAHTGEDALRKLSGLSFDFVLCSCELQDMSAEAWLDRAARLDPGIVPRSVLTAADVDSDRFRSLVTRLDMTYLARPFDGSELDRLLVSETPATV